MQSGGENPLIDGRLSVNVNVIKTKNNSQKKNTKPATMLASAHQGVARGDPMYAICDQSKVNKLIPMPWT